MIDKDREPHAARVGGYLAGFALLCLLLIALFRSQLASLIDDNRDRQRAQILREVLGNIEHNNRLTDYELSHIDVYTSGVQILRSWLAGQTQSADGVQPTAVVIEARVLNGYSGSITMLVACTTQGQIAAVRVTEHQETPGLGDQIDHRASDWIEQFANTSYDSSQPEQWQLRIDGGSFEQISGATITSRAMVQSVALVARWFRENNAWLIKDHLALPVKDGSSDE